MRLYGIPASITLAQAIVESGWGRGYVAIGGNNYFCIKSNNGWAGPTVKTMDDELDSSSFRKYLSIEESFTDHSKFLRGNSRYRPLFGPSSREPILGSSERWALGGSPGWSVISSSSPARAMRTGTSSSAVRKNEASSTSSAVDFSNSMPLNDSGGICACANSLK